MQYSFLFLLSGTLFALKALIERRHRRRKNRDSAPSQALLSFGQFRQVGVVAALIIAERIVYRHGYQFALGVELSVLKVGVFCCPSPDPCPRCEDRFVVT